MADATPFLQALKGKRPAHTPVWFMRQAGRSLPEYRRLRAGKNMIYSCLDPKLAAELTCQPVRRHGVDAAVFFSDIMVPLKLAGINVDIKTGVGPVMDKPYRNASDIWELVSHRTPDTSAITEAVRLACTKVDVPILAFAGAPFTLAAYLVEGGPSRDHLAARTLMHSAPQSWRMLANWCAELSLQFAKAQIAGGARAFQLFDSWAGSLSRADYLRYCAPYSRRVLAGVSALRIPTIHFGVGTASLLTDFAEGATCVGVDYRTDLSEAITTLRKHGSPSPLVVQGNIDPAMLACPPRLLDEHVDAILDAGKAADAHILNLGHGVPRQTDPHVLTRLVQRVHRL